MANNINEFKALCALAVGALMMTAHAQPMSPAMQGYADQMERQRIQNLQNANAYQRQQEQRIRAQQQWQAEENAIQAKIAKYRSKSYYGSLALDPVNPKIMSWSGGGKVSKELAERKAIESCGKPGCVILATLSNICVGAVRPDNITHMKQWILAYDKDPGVAVRKAAATCERIYGADGCVAIVNKKFGEDVQTACTGYDYGAYEQYQ